MVREGTLAKLDKALGAAVVEALRRDSDDPVADVCAVLQQQQLLAAKASGPAASAEASERLELRREIDELKAENARLRALAAVEPRAEPTAMGNSVAAAAPLGCLSPDSAEQESSRRDNQDAAHSLAVRVQNWIRRQPARKPDPQPCLSAAELNRKFAASASTFVYQYGSVENFFAGLEGLLGPPSPKVMEAMTQEHSSTELFAAWNNGKLRTTCPRDEWAYVTEGVAGDTAGSSCDDEHGGGRARAPSHAAEGAVHAGWRLADFAAQPKVKQAGLKLAEVAGIRAYTGPMFVRYNGTLRAKVSGAYVTTLHVVNSGIVKLSRLTPATTVYRGVAGGVLPEAFWQPNADGVMGGVELGFMSTTTERKVALGYMNQSGKEAKLLFEIRMGMIDRGADVSLLSQFPAEKEILFAPLTGLEVAAVPRVEGGAIVVELRLSCNLHDATIEQVIGKMQTSHKAMVQSMLDDLRLAGSPPLAMKPLQAVLDQAELRGYAFFNVPDLFIQATEEALAAQTAALDTLVDAATWADVPGEPTEIAALMRAMAKLSAQQDRHEVAAQLLTLAVGFLGVSTDGAAVLQKARAPFGPFLMTAQQEMALEAARLMMMSGESVEEPWRNTLRALTRQAGFDLSEFQHGALSDRSLAWINVSLDCESRGGKHGPLSSFSTEATPKAVKGSALLHAAATGDAEAVTAALTAGADANATVENGVTPLILAARAASLPAVLALLSCGADPNRATSKSQSTALFMAAEMGAMECVRAILDAGASVNATAFDGYAPLHAAVQGGCEEMVALLLARGAAVDVATAGTNATPLTLAVFAQPTCNTNVIAALLASGANIEHRDRPYGSTMLMAAVSGSVEAVEALLAAGAQPNAQNFLFFTPLVLATLNGKADAAAAVRRAGALEKVPLPWGRPTYEDTNDEEEIAQKGARFIMACLEWIKHHEDSARAWRSTYGPQYREKGAAGILLDMCTDPAELFGLKHASEKARQRAHDVLLATGAAVKQVEILGEICGQEVLSQTRGELSQPKGAVTAMASAQEDEATGKREESFSCGTTS